MAITPHNITYVLTREQQPSVTPTPPNNQSINQSTAAAPEQDTVTLSSKTPSATQNNVEATTAATKTKASSSLTPTDCCSEPSCFNECKPDTKTPPKQTLEEAVQTNSTGSHRQPTRSMTVDEARIWIRDYDHPPVKSTDPYKPPVDLPIRKHPINRFFIGLIEKYQANTRDPDKAATKDWQKGMGKCDHRINGHHTLSDSEFGIVAFQQYNPVWAFTQTTLRVLSCNWFTADTPLGDLLEEPLPFKEFSQKAKAQLRQGPIVDLGTREDWAQWKPVLEMISKGGNGITDGKPYQRKFNAWIDLNPRSIDFKIKRKFLYKPYTYDDGVLNHHKLSETKEKSSS